MSIGCQKPLCDIGAQVVVLREPLHRLALPDRVVAVDEIADLGREQEEAAVDPAAIALRLLREGRDPVACRASSAPKRLAGRTAVTVALRPCAW